MSHTNDAIVAGALPRILRPLRLTGVLVCLTCACLVAGHRSLLLAADPEAVATDARPEECTSAADESDGALMWSLERVRCPELPAVQRTDWPINPIDHFILARLEAKGMQPAAPLTRQRLIRRLYFDLWGLPPKPEDVQSFLADESPDAYERLVDRLLENSHFGERWARYWLDVVRFAETNGYERDATKPNAWKYRDWVIQAINSDKSYDRFILEQLAGDEIPDADTASRIATGFLRIGTFDDEPNDPLQYKFEQLDDLLHTTATAFLAITVKCARCHDHKFDPIPQRDYYAMLNFFTGGKPIEGGVLGYTDESRNPPVVRLLAGGDPRAEQDVVPAGFLSMLPGLNRTVDPPPDNSMTTKRREQLAGWIIDRRNPLTARVMVNRLWQHHFGEALARNSDNFGNTGLEPTHPELLDWLASELMDGDWQVKRMHKLIVMSQAYRMDSVHPLYEEYNQQDRDNTLWWRANRQRLDAEAIRDAMLFTSGQLNERMGGTSFYPPVDAEALEGLSKKGAAWGESSPNDRRRRSIYMFTKRSLLAPLMTVFDFADTTQPCSQRTVTTVAPQALALLNNAFVHEQAGHFADRVIAEAPEGFFGKIDHAYWLALGRGPSDSERDAAINFMSVEQDRAALVRNEAGEPAYSNEQIDQLVLAAFCHVLLNLNEFVYID